MKKKLDILAELGLPSLPSNNPETIIVALMWAREVLQKHINLKYAVTAPNGVDELKPVSIGGVDQWLHIRGRNRDNPVLLYLHGGPGNTMIGHMDAIQRPWEDYFTVVHWDQRQTGKSYYPADDDNAPLTVQKMIEDTEEVILYLRSYLNQDKLFVLGHSWGSVLGMHMVKRHPDWLYAYIGVGQVVAMKEGERVLYERLLNHALEQKKEQLIAKLKSIAPYPDPEAPEISFVENCAFVRAELSRMAGETGMHHLLWSDAGSMLNFDRTISPHLSLTDLKNAILGDQVAVLRSRAFAKEFMDVNLPKDIGNTFEIPIFFFSGRHDWQTPVSLSDQWFSKISAPLKHLIHFEESSHVIVNEEPGKVLMTLVNKVLPCSQG